MSWYLCCRQPAVADDHVAWEKIVWFSLCWTACDKFFIHIYVENAIAWRERERQWWLVFLVVKEHYQQQQQQKPETESTAGVLNKIKQNKTTTKTHIRLERRLLNQIKQDKMQVFQGIPFFKGMNNTKTHNSLICCQLGSCSRKCARDWRTKVKGCLL